ncbi:MAG: hypothetical protein U9O85_04195 [Euryarchaeota archaeon]|nr:hypothetical protein [Euryarchaeota archaeon]
MDVDDGQVSMDFLMAITIFAFGLVILISQVPMLFAPLQTVSTDIQPVAYRTSMILVEDGGIYNDSGNLTSEWENHINDLDNILRIGLAKNSTGFSSEDIIPNNLSRRKIDKFNSTDAANITKKLGLLVTYNGNPINYSYNISLRDFDDKPVNSSAPLLQIGDSIPTSGSVTIEKIERIVAIDNTTGLMGNRTIAGHECAKLVVCVWR